uniref:Uncharacterized protein n=1 Tax=Arundo donax TaxID=35708 RepID=A0A0A9FKA8_ARUDO
MQKCLIFSHLHLKQSVLHELLWCAPFLPR